MQKQARCQLRQPHCPELVGWRAPVRRFGCTNVRLNVRGRSVDVCSKAQRDVKRPENRLIGAVTRGKVLLKKA